MTRTDTRPDRLTLYASELRHVTDPPCTFQTRFRRQSSGLAAQNARSLAGCVDRGRPLPWWRERGASSAFLYGAAAGTLWTLAAAVIARP